MKTIEVVAAIIHQNNKILATQRGYGDYKGWWEFFWCSIAQGALQLKEHQSAQWLAKEEWERGDWLPADVLVLEQLG